MMSVGDINVISAGSENFRDGEKAMIEFIKGASIKNAKELSEGYKVGDGSITAVLSASKIMPVMKSFVKYYEKHNCFLFLEVPCTLDEEDKLHKHDEKSHKNVYYLDNIWVSDVLGLFDLFNDILINDGLVTFGIGNHEAEIGKYKYNVVNLFSEEIDTLKIIFEQNGVAENRELIIPSDIINEMNPGECVCYQDAKGRTIYDILETLTEAGLYLAEVRVEE